MKFQIVEHHYGGLFGMDPSSCVSPLISYKRDNTIVNSVSHNEINYIYIHK